MAIKDNLISWWKLNDGNDSHGTNTLTASGAPVFAAAKVGNGLTVDGNDKLTIPDNASLSTGNIDFALCAWVFLAAKGADRNAVAKDDSLGSGDREYAILYNNALDRFVFSVWTGASGAGAKSAVANSLGSPALNTWYFVVCWHDATADTVNIQVNNGAIDSVATAAAVPYDGGATFCIGGRQTSTSWWNGQVDEVGFWKRVPTVSERSLLYGGGAGVTYEDLVDPVVGGWIPLYATHIKATTPVHSGGPALIYPVWTITGPGYYPILTNQTSGAQLALDYEILNGHTLVIDTSPIKQTILDSEDGDVSGHLVAGSTYWPLLVGDNQVAVEIGRTRPQTRIDMVRTPP